MSQNQDTHDDRDTRTVIQTMAKWVGCLHRRQEILVQVPASNQKFELVSFLYCRLMTRAFYLGG